MTVTIAIGALALGLLVLVKAADAFVGAAEALALARRWSPAVIGAVVVGFGTSLPELVTSAAAAFAGEVDLAIGNAAGSNVANLTLILGVAALVAPLRGAGRGPGRDVAIAAAAGLLLIGLSLNRAIGLVDGAILVAGLVAAVVWQVASGRSRDAEVVVAEASVRRAPRLIAGLIGVIVGAQLLVWAASQLAAELGVPSIVIGSVLVAVGTSLPELATAIASARRGQTELLIGNLIGSNAFNALGVVGVAAVIGAARGDILSLDRGAMAVVVAGGVTTSVIGLWLWRRPRVGRVAGAILVCAYGASVPLLLTVS